MVAILFASKAFGIAGIALGKVVEEAFARLVSDSVLELEVVRQLDFEK